MPTNVDLPVLEQRRAAPATMNNQSQKALQKLGLSTDLLLEAFLGNSQTAREDLTRQARHCFSWFHPLSVHLPDTFSHVAFRLSSHLYAHRSTLCSGRRSHHQTLKKL